MNITLIIIGVVVLVVIVILFFYIKTRMKGKITINLNKHEFSPGETASGTLTLNLKKDIQAKSLKVGLIGIYEQRNYGKGNTGSSRQSGKAFDFRKSIDGQKTYKTGEKEYKFTIKIPQDILSSRFLNGALGSAVKAAQIISGNISSIKWYISGNLEMPGFDLSKKVRVNIG
ncbi:MAG: hypothetical protein ABIH37_04790 [archaeon]